MKILLLGSGGIKIGQAGEFDYSGSQAIKAFKSEMHEVILLNPNIATIQTDSSMADKVYYQPLEPEVVEDIIIKEKIEAISLGFGGQTALNVGVDLYKNNIFNKYNVEVLGTNIDSILLTEDRGNFRNTLNSHNLKTPKSFVATNLEEVISISHTFNYPVMTRSAFSLGGLGSGIINNIKELLNRAKQAFNYSPQILIEECLLGWKEFEYEIVRDIEGNCLTICNMENLDPMGVHTGESIVIAPAQTLKDSEHQTLRNIAIKCANIFSIIGECNIQFAINPNNGDYRIIEINPRLSRSSALASKATGYPLAFIAAKLNLGIPLYKIKNSITQNTTAFFEPSLDYVVVKIPRWDNQKFDSKNRQIGTEMKSVGEVMGIGRSFPEALQKAIQMLNIKSCGIGDYQFENNCNLLSELTAPTDRRLFAIYKWFQQGSDIESLYELTRIDKWFLYFISQIAKFEKEFLFGILDKEILLKAKKLGFSDAYIAKLQNKSEETIYSEREKLGIFPVVKQIDAFAGEFKSTTNYLYLTYHGTHNDVDKLDSSILVLGSGPYSIGSSVEFDWCTVNLARCLRKNEENVIIINSNPETVSTDYDESDRLYFEPLTIETIKMICNFERINGISISLGGQIPINLSKDLAKMNYPILGTSIKNINLAENRFKFSNMLKRLNIAQPRWISTSNKSTLLNFINEIGYPILVRPSYVLSGASMKIILDDTMLDLFLQNILFSNRDSPVVVSEFISEAKEIDFDGISQNGDLKFSAISENIEYGGIHSGDSAVVYPAKSLSEETSKQILRISRKISTELNISGPFNIQFIYKDNKIMVIECNLRASRLLPFISKVSKYNTINLISKIYLNQPVTQVDPEELSLQLGVKFPVFSNNRFPGADPISGVEMKSTGEVASIGNDLLEVFFDSWKSAGNNLQSKKILIDAPLDILIRLIKAEGFNNLKNYIDVLFIEKNHMSKKNVLAFKNCYNLEAIINKIHSQEIGTIISIPSFSDFSENSIGKNIRIEAAAYGIALIADYNLAKLWIKSINNQILKGNAV